MLSEGIMHDCILRLLRSTSDHESLECFCRLVTTTGKELDHPQAKVTLRIIGNNRETAFLFWTLFCLWVGLSNCCIFLNTLVYSCILS